ncbi:hypothetical protein BGX27_008015 [Mortierella sp. AM989]|nr:hypothetical protein BGX27_008015 [Mortierella sp. AM989]
MTAPVNSASTFYNNIGRSRSSSRSGGVVFKTRPRADSEAARSAMEAMVQARLDQITARLNNFNAQSHELHAQSQQLDKAFHDKAKRLYLVEDNLLRLQGKPGLSEEYLENGPRPRRLTNDLEELRMGVKTLRGKFQAAGSAVSAVGWWNKLKDVRDNWQPIDTPSSATNANTELLVTDKDIESVTQNRSLSRSTNTKDSHSLQHMFINPDSSSPSSVLDTTNQLASSPENSMEVAGHRTSGLRSPPLIPKGPLSGSSFLTKGFEDHSYLNSRPLSIIPDLEEPHVLLSLFPVVGNGVRTVNPSPLVKSSTIAIGSSSEQQDIVHDIDGEPQSRFSPTFTPSSRASPTFEVTKSIIQDEPNAKSDYEMKAQVQLQEPTVGDEDEVWQEVDNKSAPHQQETTKDEDQSRPEGWIQAFWRLFIRAEYLLLGTAVLGAMMPDNLFALCAGFLSAIMYGALIIHHRLTAPPGKEAPHPPAGHVTGQKKGISSTADSKVDATDRGRSYSSATSTSRRVKST